jgi:peptidoglycan/xylan/chitin deacetylase (PgdA/CDA1 family)
MSTPLLKSMFERVMASTPIGSFGRRRRRHRVLVLAYHNVVPDDEVGQGDVSLHLGFTTFVAQLDELEQTHLVIALTDAFDAAVERPRVVITFDDAYRGAVELALPELARRGLPATVFVPTGLIGCEAPWWDRFAPVGDEWDPAIREKLLIEYRGHEPAISRWAAANGHQPRDLSEWFRIASEAELVRATSRTMVTLGSHTADHVNLAVLSEPEVEAQLRSSFDLLRTFASNVVPWVAYPYGLFSPVAMRVAERLEIAGALAIGGGWWPSRPASRFALPRWNVPAGISIEGFDMRMAGYWCR